MIGDMWLEPKGYEVPREAVSRRRPLNFEAECDRAVMQVVCSATQLWSSGKLDLVEVDDSE